MKKNVVSKAIYISVPIVLILLIVIFITIYSHWGDSNAAIVKDSLSTTSGIFGGITTLAAALIAAYLYNDWKEQPKLDIALEMYDTTRDIKVKVQELRSLAPYYNHEVELKDFFPIRDDIVKKIDHLLYLERKYRALMQENDFQVFKHHTDTKYNSANYLFFLIGKTSSHFSYLLRCREHEESSDSVEFSTAYKLFNTTYVTNKIHRDADGHVILVEDIGDMIDTEIKNIYNDIEQLTKN